MTVLYAVFLGFGLLKVSAINFILNVLFFFIFSILAGFINDSIGYFVGMLVFHTDHLFGLNMMRNTLQSFLGGKMIPLSYMGVLGTLFSYTPFAFLNSVPVLTIMGKMDYPTIILYIFIALLWIFVIEFANNRMFNHAIKKITVQGG